MRLDKRIRSGWMLMVTIINEMAMGEDGLCNSILRCRLRGYFGWWPDWIITIGVVTVGAMMRLYGGGNMMKTISSDQMT